MVRRYAEVFCCLQIGSDSQKVFFQLRSGGARIQHPLSRTKAIGKGLLGTKGLRADNEQRGRGRQIQ